MGQYRQCETVHHPRKMHQPSTSLEVASRRSQSVERTWMQGTESQHNPSQCSSQNCHQHSCTALARESDAHHVQQLHHTATVDVFRASVRHAPAPCPSRTFPSLITNPEGRHFFHVHDAVRCPSQHSRRSTVTSRMCGPCHVPRLQAQVVRLHHEPCHGSSAAPDERAIGI